MRKRPPVSSPADSPASLAWARRYLPEYFSDAPGDFHAALLADLQDAARRLLARVAPRGHAKSTCGALAYPLWCVCEQRCRNIVIVTHENALATQFVRDLRHELETNERIRADYGDLCAASAAKSVKPKQGKKKTSSAESAGDPAAQRRAPRKWAEAQFITATGISVQARSAGASFRGLRVGPNRPDLVICDDIEKDELVATPEGRRKLERWLQRVVLPALAPDGRLIVLGSLLHYDSLLANLRDPQRFPGWDYKVYRALEARQAADGQYYLEALWPARWPVERLQEERRRIGTLAFEQEYQANPIDDTLRVFRPEWLHRYDPAELARADLIPLMAVDPATGAADGDYFALWIGGLDRTSGVIYTRALILERIGIVEQVKRIVAAFEEWKPVKIGIETTAYQVALKQILDDYGRRQRFYLPIVALQATANKRARIEGSAPFYENGTFRLPPALDSEIEAQFLHFPKAKHDDAPDVCAMGIELARTLRTARIEGATAARRPVSGRKDW